MVQFGRFACPVFPSMPSSGGPCALGSREEICKHSVSILEVAASGEAIPHPHLFRVAGRDEEVITYLDVAMVRWRGLRHRSHKEPIWQKGDERVGVEREAIQVI